MSNDPTQDLSDAIKQAAADKTALCIHGGDTKNFYGRPPFGNPLSTQNCAGIVDYEPTELVITARAGTPLMQIETALAEQQQMLAFEPPFFGEMATLGGAIASGLSGPRRPYVGAVRDFVLGVRMINGRGEDLRFGGRVMKNVAGYDVSRLMVGSMGTLGLLLEISLKVLPIPRTEETLVFELDHDEVIAQHRNWARKPSPISATSYHEGRLHVRLSGSEKGVNAARTQLGGEKMENGNIHWKDIREHHHSFFTGQDSLWRISVPPATPKLNLPGSFLWEWGGALRWLITEVSAADVRSAVDQFGGHATLFCGGNRESAFHPLTPPVKRLHVNLKTAFDPAGVLNPGRMYKDI